MATTTCLVINQGWSNLFGLGTLFRPAGSRQNRFSKFCLLLCIIVSMIQWHIKYHISSIWIKIIRVNHKYFSNKCIKSNQNTCYKWWHSGLSSMKGTLGRKGSEQSISYGNPLWYLLLNTEILLWYLKMSNYIIFVWNYNSIIIYLQAFPLDYEKVHKTKDAPKMALQMSSFKVSQSLTYISYLCNVPGSFFKSSVI